SPGDPGVPRPSHALPSLRAAALRGGEESAPGDRARVHRWTASLGRARRRDRGPPPDDVAGRGHDRASRRRSRRGPHVMRPRLVIGNWKMNPPTVDDARVLARAVVAAGAVPGVVVGIAPAAIALVAVSEAVRGSHVSVFAQDVHWEEKGAFTGQI